MKIKIAIVVAVLLGVNVQAQSKRWTLKECIEYALENNITIKQSELNVEEAEIGKLDAIGGVLPSLNLSGSNSWSSGLSQNPVTNTNETLTFRNSSYQANIGLTIFDGLRNIRRIQRAKINQLLSQYNLGKSKDDIALNVANAYLQVLVNKESLKVVEAQHEITEKQLKRTQDLVEAGVLPQGDVLEIKATSADEITRIVRAENAIQIARINLAQMLLIKDYESFDIEEREYIVPVATILETPVERIIAQAREARYEVQIAEQNRQIAEKDLEIARGAYYPTLSAFVNYNTRELGNNTFESFVDPDNPFVNEQIGVVESTGESVIRTVPNVLAREVGPTPFFEQLYQNDGLSYGFSLNIPVFNGFSTRNNVKRNKVQIKRTEYQLEQAKLNLDSNVYQAYLDAKGSAEAYQAAEVAVEAQEQAYAYAKDRYDIGMTNAFDFSQSKFRLENAQSTAVQAKFDYIFKLKVLELYFGIKVADIKL